MITSSYYWGYCLLGLPGGRLAEIYSAKWIIFSGNVLVVLLHLCTPLMLQLDNVYVLVASRILSGLATGITYPAMIVLMARWSPPAERYILCAIVFGGMYFGASNAVFITIFFADRNNWEQAFYVSGASIIFWLIFHSVYVDDYPQIRKGLKADELEYITSSLDNVLYDKKDVRKARIPWKGIMSSPPFYALLMVHTCVMLIFWVTFHRIVDDIKNFIWLRSIGQLSRGVLVSSPFAWALLVSLFVGLVFSTLNQQKAVSKPAAIRFAVTIGLVTPIGCLIMDYFAMSDWELVVKPMIMVMLAGLNNMVQANHIDISPNYAGTLMGITNSVSSSWGMIIRYIRPEVTPRDHSHLIIIYGATVGFSLVSMLVYILFLSADVQEWNWNLMESRRGKSITEMEKGIKDKGKDKNNKDKKNEKNKDKKKENNKDNKNKKNKEKKKEKTKKNDNKKEKPKIKKKSEKSKNTPEEVDSSWFGWARASPSK